jgi:hypothetical protein
MYRCKCMCLCLWYVHKLSVSFLFFIYLFLLVIIWLNCRLLNQSLSCYAKRFCGTSHMSDIRRMSVAMQQPVHLISMVTCKLNNTRAITTMERNYHFCCVWLNIINIVSCQSDWNCLKENLKKKAKLVVGPRWAPDVMWFWLSLDHAATSKSHPKSWKWKRSLHWTRQSSHRKYKRLKLAGGHVYDRSSV